MPSAGIDRGDFRTREEEMRSFSKLLAKTVEAQPP